MTLAVRSEILAFERALPEVAQSQDIEEANAFFMMRHLLPITEAIEFHFNEHTPPELLYLQDFWEQRQQLVDDYVAIWELWRETVVTLVYVEWWNAFDKRGSTLRADPAFQASEAQLAADPN